MSFLSFFPSQSHRDPTVCYIIHSSAKAFHSFVPCPSITPLRKPHSWVNPTAHLLCFSTHAARHCCRKCSHTGGPPANAWPSPGPHCCPSGLLCLPAWLPVIWPSLFCSLLNALQTPQAVTSPPTSPRNGVTNILQPPLNLPASPCLCLPLVFHNQKALILPT